MRQQERGRTDDLPISPLKLDLPHLLVLDPEQHNSTRHLQHLASGDLLDGRCCREGLKKREMEEEELVLRRASLVEREGGVIAKVVVESRELWEVARGR